MSSIVSRHSTPTSPTVSALGLLTTPFYILRWECFWFSRSAFSPTSQPIFLGAWLPSCFIWRRLAFPDWSRTRLLFALLAPTTLLIIDTGQNGLLSGALFIAAMRLLDRRPVWSGILLGILSFKPHLGLLIPFALLAGRLWIPFAVASATVLILAVLSLAIWGADPWIAYIEQDAVAAAMAFLERGAGFAMDMSLTRSWPHGS